MATRELAASEAACVGCSGTKLKPFFRRHGYRLVRCADCRLVFVANPPSADELRRLYSFDSGYHVALSEDSAEIAKRQTLADIQLAALARHAEPGRVLDVGAAAGFFVRAARAAGWVASGVELSDDTARVARERYGLDVITGSLEDADLEAGTFDAVTLWDVIEHVHRPLETMQRVAGLLKPGGIAAISTPNLDGLYPRLSRHVGRLVRYWPAVEPPFHLSQFSVRTLDALLTRAGFEIIEVRHECQPLGYTFGSRERLLRGKSAIPRLIYAAVFAPLAWIGPHIRAGDEVTVVARKL